ncbi:hypothetical protein EJB05_18631 [Eragrostis curvula]|uniref:DUF6598 domain-containing protein n=1 Tax=Eragrostis curvula TaxID=38414 RepID=A0A5J9VM67_9POAL|nr:hypothetical protein EJB05_18631 [Eragrostis curvula]
MEIARSMLEVQVPAAQEKRIMLRNKAKSILIHTELEELFKERREKGDDFAAQRWVWEKFYAKHFGSFEDTTVVPPMCYAFGPIPLHAVPEQTLQIFSVKVAELKEGNDLQWPLQVYGFIAIRDSIDPRRNLLFQRDRSDCQTITEKEPFLLLTGPSRAVVLIDPISFEVQLKAKGKTASEDKVLAVDVLTSQHAVAYLSYPPRTFTINLHGIRSKLELTQALLANSVEATIMVEIHDGSWPASVPGRVTACTGSMQHQDIVLLDSGHGALCFSDSGMLKLPRCVVSVELDGELKVNVEAIRGLKGYTTFKPKRSTISYQTCYLGHQKNNHVRGGFSCTLGITVAWSLFRPLVP